MAIIAATVIGGGTVALINAGKTQPPLPSPTPVIQPSLSPTSDKLGKKPGCEIKGNISNSGERIYHMQGQRYYNKTVIDTSKGERWFCTEQEAINAGWRRSKV